MLQMHFASIFPTCIERLVRAVGWSPIGKSIGLLIEEGQDPALFGTRLIGAVKSLNDDGSATVNTSAGESFLIVPRHVGYGFYYLKVGKISAYLVADSRAGDPRIALGILSLI
jgi:hypothetical protein